MARNFVLAFGGTGARCAEAVAYLAASRAITDPCHLLVIDPDQSNGNVDTVRKQLQRYLAIQQMVIRGEGPKAFFSTELNEGRPTFFWATPSGGKSWSSTLDYPVLEQSTRDLLDLLYDEDDLSLSFEKGYIGRAHIGSLDLLQTLDHAMKTARDAKDGDDQEALYHFYSQLRAAAQGRDGANLVVVGSIFGGTGASGLPAIPPLLREALGQLADKVNIACVQVAPYFTFPDGADRDPDSALHPLATQTALRHYAVTDVGYQRIYLVGGPDRPPTATHNNPGGSNQKNRAHVVELAAALGVAHFFAQPKPANDAKGSTELLASSAQALGWGKLPFSGETDARRNLVSLATFALAHVGFFGGMLQNRHFEKSLFERMLKSKADRELGGREVELEDLQGFCARYLDWIRELQEGTDRSLFTVDTDIVDDSALRVMAGGRSKADAATEMRERLDIQSAELAKSDEDVQQSGVGFYVDTLTRTADWFCRRNYASWS